MRRFSATQSPSVWSPLTQSPRSHPSSAERTHAWRSLRAIPPSRLLFSGLRRIPTDLRSVVIYVRKGVLERESNPAHFLRLHRSSVLCSTHPSGDRIRRVSSGRRTHRVACAPCCCSSSPRAATAQCLADAWPLGAYRRRRSRADAQNRQHALLIPNPLSH